MPYETRPTRSSMSTPRYRRALPSLSGSAISVSNAMTPSRPGTKSDICHSRVVRVVAVWLV